MTDPVKVLSDDEVDRIQQLPVTMNGNIKPQPGVVLTAQDRNALCATVRALSASLSKANEVVEEAVHTNTALREQLAQAQRELETAKTPAWTCAICGQFRANTDELMRHECGMPYRVVRYGNGYEASMWVRSGVGGHFWTPLLATGYWAEPESFSTGIVKGLHLFNTHEEAQQAIERARLLNTKERILSIANPTSDPAT